MNLLKKLRFALRFLSAIFRKQYRTIFVGLLLGASFYLVIPRIASTIPKPIGTQKIGVIGQYSTNELPDQVLKELSYGLTQFDTKGEVIPALCESWTVADEGKTYIFNIKKDDIYWHDGKKFETSDINYNFKEIGFTINQNQVTFSLKEPYSPFPGIVSKPLFKKGLIGLGNYKIKRIERSGKAVKSVHLVPAWDNSLPKKIFRFYHTENELKTAFNLGEINKIEGIFDIENLYFNDSVNITKNVMNDAYLGIFFDTRKAPFSEKTFRQALSYAIPKENSLIRALGPINPDSWAYNPDVKPYNQDLTRAKELLGNDESLKNLKIKISTLPQHEKVANTIKESWDQLGIESSVQIVTFIPESFDVLIAAREIPKDPDQYILWHSNQPANLSGFTSLRIDKLLEDGRITVDKEERKDIYFDFQRFLVEESPVIFLSHPITYTVERK
jgi:peptide/nickel transport system substrate-binding protein